MQGIVIQGPTTYFKEISDNWSGWPNVIWSTWTTEPQFNIDYIRSKNIEVIQSVPPQIPGDQNINYQLSSTFTGLNYLHRRGITEVLKIRSDHTISDIKETLEILKGRKLAFLALSNGTKRKDLIYELEGVHYGHDYPSDNIIYGKIEDMMLMFNFNTDKNYNIPPEALICYNYMTNIKPRIKFDFGFDNFIRNGITFFVGDLAVKNIKVCWLKKNLEMVNFYNNEYFIF